MLKLKASPTFKAKVGIPAAGGETVEIEVEFKHMTKGQLEQFLTGDEAKTRKDEDTILAIASGWSGVDAEFNKASLTELFQHYHAAARVMVEAYFLELTQARLKN